MRAHATPLLVNAVGKDDQGCAELESIPLRAGSADSLYDERWLQLLIQAHPMVLPVGRIEPALVPLESVCIELPLPSGYVDNLLMTQDGGLALVEAKLWRNPAARRAVVGQILDYAKDLSHFTYDDLERAVRVALKTPSRNLYNIVCGDDAPPDDETTFVDAVSRNLRLGRMLLIIAGDGIQEGAEQLAEFLQRHVGLHFTLGLVELSLWRIPGGDQVLIQPKVLAQTVQIERAVIRVEESALGRIIAEPASSVLAQRITLTAEEFYEKLGSVDPTIPARLKAFLAANAAQGVHAEYRVMLTIKWRGPDGRDFNLGVIDSQGRFFTDQAHSAAAAVGRLHVIHQYKAALAALIPGARVEATPKAMGTRLVLPNQPGALSLLLDAAPAWTKAVTDCINALRIDDSVADGVD